MRTRSSSSSILSLAMLATPSLVHAQADPAPSSDTADAIVPEVLAEAEDVLEQARQAVDQAIGSIAEVGVGSAIDAAVAAAQDLDPQAVLDEALAGAVEIDVEALLEDSVGTTSDVIAAAQRWAQDNADTRARR